MGNINVALDVKNRSCNVIWVIELGKYDAGPNMLQSNTK